MISKKIIFMISIILIGIAVIMITFWYLLAKEDSKILVQISAQRFDSGEKQVSEKITRLLIETKANPESADRWGRLGMNLYIHDY